MLLEVKSKLSTPELSPNTPPLEIEDDVLKSDIVHDDEDLGLQETEDDGADEVGHAEPSNMFMNNDDVEVKKEVKDFAEEELKEQNLEIIKSVEIKEDEESIEESKILIL